MNPTTTGVPLSDRLQSLDAFRGFTIAAMLLVNNKATDAAFHRQFSHAAWGEFVTFCDMIFPWFLLIVGVALPWSVASSLRRGVTWPRLLLKSSKRALILIILGILIDCSVQKKFHVGMNVLQLIGLAFLAGIAAYRLPRMPRLVLAGALLLAWMLFILFVPIPGEGAGHFEPGKNIVGTINNVLRPWHLAGILSVIPTTALVLIGTAVGETLKARTAGSRDHLMKLLIAGTALTLAGLITHLLLPMSKPLWTSSYILFSGGLGILLLTAFHIVIDLKGWRAWAFPFIVYGMNAIAAYFISIIVRIHTVQEWKTVTPSGDPSTVWADMINACLRIAGPNLGAWLFTTGYLTFWFLVLLVMYRKRWFWKV